MQQNGYHDIDFVYDIAYTYTGVVSCKAYMLGGRLRTKPTGGWIRQGWGSARGGDPIGELNDLKTHPKLQ